MKGLGFAIGAFSVSLMKFDMAYYTPTQLFISLKILKRTRYLKCVHLNPLKQNTLIGESCFTIL